MGLRLQRSEAAEYGRRSGAHRRTVERWNIEGEHVSLLDIAVRLKVRRSSAQRRLAAAQGMTGPVTWARLRGDA